MGRGAIAYTLYLRIKNKIKPRIFDEKRGSAALLIKNSGFCFVRDSKDTSEKEYPDFLREGAAKPRPLSKNRDILSWRSPKTLDFACEAHTKSRVLKHWRKY